jgi:hypothetical protein
VASAIHERSPRRDRALVRVNCASVPAELFESEFFGHVKGAFTGALRDRVGRFQLADRGALFLDEVGEIPFALQGKLLRVLQEGQFERVGDDTTRKVDVRIIAATNRDLKRDVEAGRFRQDLYYRLSVFPIELPPLRERREDIGALAAHLFGLACARLKRPEMRLTNQDVAILKRYDWPGNVRELQHVIERAIILGQGRPRLDLALPGRQAGSESAKQRQAAIVVPTERRVVRSQVRRRAGERPCGLGRRTGRCPGPAGCGLLGIKATTLASDEGSELSPTLPPGEPPPAHRRDRGETAAHRPRITIVGSRRQVVARARSARPSCIPSTCGAPRRTGGRRGIRSLTVATAGGRGGAALNRAPAGLSGSIRAPADDREIHTEKEVEMSAVRPTFLRCSRRTSSGTTKEAERIPL